MRTADSSVIIAAFAAWHEFHEPALVSLNRTKVAVGHALVETYSVATRLPAPHRVSPLVISTFLESRFPDDPLVLGGAQITDLLVELGAEGIAGGRIYDAWIGATARHFDHSLVTLDARATLTYEQIGCRYELLEI